MPADQLVRVIHALTEGLVFQRLLTPELIPDEIFHAAFAAAGEEGQKTNALISERAIARHECEAICDCRPLCARCCITTGPDKKPLN